MSGYDDKVVCHDHFSGSAHCLECGGHCKLTGPAMAYTALVRALFDYAAFKGEKPPYPVMVQMRRSGVNADALWARAEAAFPKTVKP